MQEAESSEEPTPCLARRLLALSRFVVCRRCDRNLNPLFSALTLELLKVGQAKADSSMDKLGGRRPDHHARVFCQAYGSPRASLAGVPPIQSESNASRAGRSLKSGREGEAGSKASSTRRERCGAWHFLSRRTCEASVGDLKRMSLMGRKTGDGRPR